MEDFLLQCFVKEIDKRATVQALNQHPWLNSTNACSPSTSSSSGEPAGGPASSSPPGRRGTTSKPSLFHTLFSKKDKEESSAPSNPATLDRNKSLSAPLVR